LALHAGGAVPATSQFAGNIAMPLFYAALFTRIPPLNTTHPSTAVPSDGGGGGNDGSGQIFGGANSFLLHAYVDADRIDILNAMQAAGFKAIRIFILELFGGDKVGNSRAVRDVEGPVGVFNDDQLNMIDQLMLEASQRGMKLIITLHDRYSLGCWCAAARGAWLGGQGARDAGPWGARGAAFAAGLPSLQQGRRAVLSTLASAEERRVRGQVRLGQCRTLLLHAARRVVVLHERGRGGGHRPSHHLHCQPPQRRNGQPGLEGKGSGRQPKAAGSNKRQREAAAG
jgi:hypothetical protein